MRRWLGAVCVAAVAAMATAAHARQPDPPAPVDEISQHPATGVWSAWLANGVRAHYLQAKGTRLTVTVTLAGGELLENAGTRGLSAAAAAAWSDARDARESAGRAGVVVESRASGDAMVLSLSAEAGEAAAVFSALRAMLTEPTIDEGALAEWRSDELLSITERERDMHAVFKRLVLDTLHPEPDPRSLPPTPDRLRAIDAAAAGEWLSDRLRDSPVELALVGDIDRDAAFEAIVETAGRLGRRERIGPGTHAELRRLPRRTGPLLGRGEAPEETETALVMRAFYGADLSNLRDVRTLHMAAETLSVRFPAMLGAANIGASGIRVGSAPGVEHPGFGLVWVSGSCRAGEEIEMMRLIESELDRFALWGPTPTELGAARGRVLGLVEAQRADPAAWALRLSQLTYRGHTAEQIASVAEVYADITANDIRDVFARYHTPESTVRVIVAPRSD